MTDSKEIAEQVIKGRRLKNVSECAWMKDAETEELISGADAIRDKLCGKRVDLCAIINGRSGKCTENCRFCAQSAHNHTGIDEYEFLSPDKIVEDCKKYEKHGVDRYSIVTAGRTLEGRDLDYAVDAYKRMHEECPDIMLCASHGLLSEEAFNRIYAAGVKTYHCNIETSRAFFPKICSTHTFDDKIREIKMAEKAGFNICCGGIIGMGESWDDRIDMALTIAELGVASIPINTLIPIKGTPLENTEKLSKEDILRTVAIFRYINPTAHIRIAAGRSIFGDGGKQLFRAGANATLTGDMLTTTGNNTDEDRQMLKSMGFEIKQEEN